MAKEAIDKIVEPFIRTKHTFDVKNVTIVFLSILALLGIFTGKISSLNMLLGVFVVLATDITVTYFTKKKLLFPKSGLITVLIIYLILNGNLPLLIPITVGVIAVLSKYIIKLKGRNMFNPAVTGLVLASLFSSLYLDWWVDEFVVLVIIFGVVTSYMANRFRAVIGFVLVYSLLLVSANPSLITSFWYSITFFFVFFMLTEPNTSPATNKGQWIFGAIVGLFSVITQFYIFPQLFLPLGLLAGNAFTPFLDGLWLEKNYGKFKAKKLKLGKINKLNRVNWGVKIGGFKDKCRACNFKTFHNASDYFVYLDQHKGGKNELKVKVGSKVKIYDVLGSSDAEISSKIHSPVNGKVTNIHKTKNHDNKETTLITIKETGGRKDNNRVDRSVNWRDLPGTELIEIIKEKGVVGLGGAVFPTHVKLNPPDKIDTLIINACECEPTLTVDERLIIEELDKIIEGIEIVKKIVKPKAVYITIKEDKIEAISAIKKHTKRVPWLGLIVLPDKYPMGSEKILIKLVTGKDADTRPFQLGTLVHNIGTVFAVYQAVAEGKALVSRGVTLSGEEKGCFNLWVKIGTPVKEILKKQGFDLLLGEEAMVGGILMGGKVQSLDVPITKSSSGIYISKIKNYTEKPCIRCGKCISVCPVDLHPLQFVNKANKLKEFEKYCIEKCIECGVCTYVCPSRIHINKEIRRIKEILKHRRDLKGSK